MEKAAAETVEYYVPTLGFELAPYLSQDIKQGIHHVGRYEWACRALQTRRPSVVIDIACGAGYGSFMLAEALPDTLVVGVDYDTRAVEHAERSFKKDNLSFRQGDIARWVANGEPLGPCDAIVSFDTIEHVLHREIALIRMSDSLSDDGLLLLSTPCGRRDYNNLLPGWEHHKIEYGYPDLYRLLGRFFRKVIAPRHPEFPAMEIWDRVNEGRIRYFNRMNPVICAQPVRVSIPDYAVEWDEPIDGNVRRGRDLGPGRPTQ